MSKEFTPFPKMARWSREVVITEKIDGTNASIFIGDDGEFLVGSRNRWITPETDNAGFARWAQANKDELMLLGPGHHFGEWWGLGIQRNYGLTEKRFSLFNTERWARDDVRPDCCGVVPILYKGLLVVGAIENAINELATNGSIAAPGFMNPEGVVLYHVAARIGFKKTIKNDEVPKSFLKERQQ